MFTSMFDDPFFAQMHRESFGGLDSMFRAEFPADPFARQPAYCQVRDPPPAQDQCSSGYGYVAVELPSAYHLCRHLLLDQLRASPLRKLRITTTCQRA